LITRNSCFNASVIKVQLDNTATRTARSALALTDSPALAGVAIPAVVVLPALSMSLGPPAGGSYNQGTAQRDSYYLQCDWLQQLPALSATGPILSLLPIIVTGALYGLAMDCEVFPRLVHEGGLRLPASCPMPTR
jgi:hypothetical protein